MSHLLSRSYGRGGRRYSGDPLALGRSMPGYGESDDTVTLMQICFKDSQGLARPRKWEVIFQAERKKKMSTKLESTKGEDTSDCRVSVQSVIAGVR